MTAQQLTVLKHALEPLRGELWQVSHDRLHVVTERGSNGTSYLGKVADVHCQKRAAFMAAFDPVTVEALLEEVTALRQINETLTRELADARQPVAA